MAYEPILPPPVQSHELRQTAPLFRLPRGGMAIYHNYRGRQGARRVVHDEPGTSRVAAGRCFSLLCEPGSRQGGQPEACGTPTQGDGDHLSLNVEHMTIQVQNRLDRR